MTATLRLYEITADLEAIADELVESGGELTTEMNARLELMEGKFSEKVERCALMIRNLEATSEAASKESARLRDLAGAKQKAADRLREYVAFQMEIAGIPKVETALVKARIQNAKPRITWTKSVEELPEEYRRVTIAPNLRRAHDTLSLGEFLPDGFEVIEGGKTLVLR